MSHMSIEEILQESKEISLDYSCLEQNLFSINSSVLILGQSQESKDLFKLLSEDDNLVFLKNKDEILSIQGHFGSYEIFCKDENFTVGQIVSFYKDTELTRLKGCYLVSEFSNPHILRKTLKENMAKGEGHLSKILSYHTVKCQYHHRFLNKTCLKCLNTCPSLAIFADDETRELKFFDIDCTDCGKCVMVCPSGAIQRFSYNQESIALISRLYFNFVPILSTQEPLPHSIPQGFAPLALPNLDILNETYLLTIIQESSSPLIIYASEISSQLQASVDFINQIFNQIFGEKGVFVVNCLEDLPNLKPNPLFHYTYSQTQDDFLRKIFSDRLRFYIKDEDFGLLHTPNHSYGKIIIDPSKCTLCNSCVGACNTQSLITGNFEILHNSSLCTACGYCTKICPENAIEEVFNAFELQGKWFEYHSLVKDEGFSCVECKKIFSNKKPIQKIKEQMTPFLNGDPLKIRALECCSDCKVKIMFEEKL